MDLIIREPLTYSLLYSRGAAQIVLVDLTCSFGILLDLGLLSHALKVSATSKSWWRG